ncbi:MAG: transcription antitermination factor NusB [Gordonia sp. (in: high G+C Gram-positive bacteria)]|uniref:transcription antitermination factor NusB n=1 Tax=Gordonia sp. (in: high G+C Gram-positive bacteria) TaxID=84139 RepID=UPI0039E35A26
MSTADRGRPRSGHGKGGEPRGRHRQRRRAVDLLFESDLKDVPATTLVTERREVFDTDDSVGEMTGYAVAIVDGVTANREQIDAVISARLQNWKFDRLPGVDRAILRLATWELLYASDVDIPVVISEAVALATELSTDESPAFVNGVLDRIATLAPQARAASAGE